MGYFNLCRSAAVKEIPGTEKFDLSIRELPQYWQSLFFSAWSNTQTAVVATNPPPATTSISPAHVGRF